MTRSGSLPFLGDTIRVRRDRANDAERRVSRKRGGKRQREKDGKRNVVRPLPHRRNLREGKARKRKAFRNTEKRHLSTRPKKKAEEGIGEVGSRSRATCRAETLGAHRSEKGRRDKREKKGKLEGPSYTKQAVSRST